MVHDFFDVSFGLRLALGTADIRVVNTWPIASDSDVCHFRSQDETFTCWVDPNSIEPPTQFQKIIDDRKVLFGTSLSYHLSRISHPKSFTNNPEGHHHLLLALVAPRRCQRSQRSPSEEISDGFDSVLLDGGALRVRSVGQVLFVLAVQFQLAPFRRQIPDLVCEMCELTLAQWYCPADSAHLCDSCDSKHHSSSSILSRHSRLLVSQSPFLFGHCSTHPSEKVNSVCITCYTFSCPSCQSFSPPSLKDDDSHNHVLVSTTDAYRDSSSDLDSSFLAPELRSKHGVLLGLYSNYRAVQDRVDRAAASLLSQLDSHFTRQLVYLDSRRRQLQLYSDSLDWLVSFMEHVTLSLGAAEYVYLRRKYSLFAESFLERVSLRVIHPRWLLQPLEFWGGFTVESSGRADSPAPVQESLPPGDYLDRSGLTRPCIPGVNQPMDELYEVVAPDLKASNVKASNVKTSNVGKASNVGKTTNVAATNVGKASGDLEYYTRLVDSSLVDSNLVDKNLVDSNLVDKSLVDSNLVDKNLGNVTPRHGIFKNSVSKDTKLVDGDTPSVFNNEVPSLAPSNAVYSKEFDGSPYVLAGVGIDPSTNTRNVIPTMHSNQSFCFTGDISGGTPSDTPCGISGDISGDIYSDIYSNIPSNIYSNIPYVTLTPLMVDTMWSLLSEHRFTPLIGLVSACEVTRRVGFLQDMARLANSYGSLHLLIADYAGHLRAKDTPEFLMLRSVGSLFDLLSWALLDEPSTILDWFYPKLLELDSTLESLDRCVESLVFDLSSGDIPESLMWSIYQLASPGLGTDLLASLAASLVTRGDVGGADSRHIAYSLSKLGMLVWHGDPPGRLPGLARRLLLGVERFLKLPRRPAALRTRRTGDALSAARAVAPALLALRMEVFGDSARGSSGFEVSADVPNLHELLALLAPTDNVH